MDAIRVLSTTLDVSNNTIAAEDTQRLQNTVRNIGKLVMIDRLAGQRVGLYSPNIQFAQSREFVEDLFEKHISLNDSATPTVRFYPGTFDHIDDEKKQRMTSVDIQLIQWNRRLSVDSNGILSDVISCTVVDNDGKDVEIRQVGNQSIEIKIYSPHITENSVCKFFDVVDREWKLVGAKEVQPGISIICVTPHLTDFAAFEATEGQPQPEWNRNLLWLLMILLVVPVGAVGIVITVFAVRKLKRRRERIAKQSKMDSAIYRELPNVSPKV